MLLRSLHRSLFGHWTRNSLALIVLAIIFGTPLTSTFAANKTKADTIMKPHLAVVRQLTATDVWNNGDASDIQIEFDAALDTESGIEYRLLIVKASHADRIDLESAEQVPSGFYTSLETTDSRTFELPTEATDVEGELIVEDTAYVVFLLSITPDENILAKSNEITLHNETIVRTLVPQLQAATGGVAIDEDGNVYVGDIGLAPQRQGTKVFRITPEGDVSTFAEGLLGASGNAFGPDGFLYQSNFSRDSVSRISPDGEVTEYVTEGIRRPVGIAVTEDGTLYIASCGNGSIYQVTPDGSTERLALSALFSCANGITLDDDGNLYVANFLNGNIIKRSLDGELSVFVELPGNNNGHIVYGGDGILYATARSAHQIYAITVEGDISLLAGSGERGHDDGPAFEATFSLPNDINVSPNGRVLYVNEVFNVNRNINFPSVVRMIVLARE